MIPYLIAQGHKVLNLDLIPFPDPSAGVYTLKTDLTDSGQVFNALTAHYDMSGYEEASLPSPPDVVIHFAGKCWVLLFFVVHTANQLQHMLATCSFQIANCSKPTRGARIM